MTAISVIVPPENCIKPSVWLVSKNKSNITIEVNFSVYKDTSCQIHGTVPDRANQNWWHKSSRLLLCSSTLKWCSKFIKSKNTSTEGMSRFAIRWNCPNLYVCWLFKSVPLSYCDNMIPCCDNAFVFNLEALNHSNINIHEIFRKHDFKDKFGALLR